MFSIIFVFAKIAISYNIILLCIRLSIVALSSMVKG